MATRLAHLHAALQLLDATMSEVWPIEAEDVRTARAFASRHPELGARDLIHLESGSSGTRSERIGLSRRDAMRFEP